VRIVARAGLRVAATAGPTFHFNRGVKLLPAIDHVLHSPEFEFSAIRVIRDRMEGIWPSDHYPVFVTLTILQLS